MVLHFSPLSAASGHVELHLILHPTTSLPPSQPGNSSWFFSAVPHHDPAFLPDSGSAILTDSMTRAPCSPWWPRAAVIPSSQHPSTRAGAESIQLIYSGRALQALGATSLGNFGVNPFFGGNCVHLYGLHVYYALVDLDSSGPPGVRPTPGLTSRTQAVYVCVLAYTSTHTPTTLTPAKIEKCTRQNPYLYPRQNIASHASNKC